MQRKTICRQTKDDVLAAIRKHRLVPVVRVASREQALCAAEGIVSAKFPLIEITMTVPGAIGIIEELSTCYADKLIVGAGTVLDAATCESALRTGAGFIVSPSFDAAVIRTANNHDTVCIAGALTPTEIVAARLAGADMVKVFPCGLVGGPRYIRALKGPLPDIQLIPSSGSKHKALFRLNFARSLDHRPWPWVSPSSKNARSKRGIPRLLQKTRPASSRYARCNNWPRLTRLQR